MSFSGKVKEELSRRLPEARHCGIAELSAIVSMCGTAASFGGGRYALKIQSENIFVAKKGFDLLKKIFRIDVDVSVRRNISCGSAFYTAAVKRPSDALAVLKALKLVDEYKDGFKEAAADPIITQQMCCKRAFLRGAFLAAGSISDPKKAYHFEIVCPSYGLAEFVQSLICRFSMDAKIIERKKSYVVYLKEGSQIVDMLNVTGAHICLMELENVRILKEMRNNVNRKVNCETANIVKTVSAAVKQIEDITFLRDNLGLDKLSEGLEETALARLANPDATLKELGEMMSPPVGKSGMNHRLRKLSETAEKIRERTGGRATS